MRKIGLVCCLFLLGPVCRASSWSDYVELTVRAAVQRPAAHPRLLARAEDFERLRTATNELVRLGRERVIFRADEMRRFPLPMRTLEGRRLLAVSQRVLDRVATLAMAYRLTGNTRYAARALAEAETACGFKDWNPRHFLDVAEMTVAVALAYDWLHDCMTRKQRETLREGLLKNGLRERTGAPKTGPWVDADNNWGAVCHGGLAVGAIALMEDEPELATRILARAVTALPRPLASFAPDGGYPEGPGYYWGYAMTFSVLAIDAVERVCGTDFGLCDLPGFRASADYLDSLTGPTGLKFNYSDAGISPRQDLLARRTSEPCSWWLARRFDRPDTLVAFEDGLYRALCADRTPLHPSPRRSFERFFPFTLLWMDPPCRAIAEPKTPLCRLISGSVPVAIQRTDWERTGWYVGLKGGSPLAPHGHMDGGAFVLDAKGVRWAADLGSEDYHRMEDGKRDLWNVAQNSDRWKIFRLGPESHNILRIDRTMPYAAGAARFTAFTNAPVCKAVLDLTSLYPNASRVTRTGTLVPGGGYILEDLVEGLEKDALVTWQMLTPARVKETDRNRLVLAQKGPDGEEVELSLTVSDRHATWEARDVGAVPGVDESANPGMTMLTFSLLASEAGTVEYAVRFE